MIGGQSCRDAGRCWYLPLLRPAQSIRLEHFSHFKPWSETLRGRGIPSSRLRVVSATSEEAAGRQALEAEGSRSDAQDWKRGGQSASRRVQRGLGGRERDLGGGLSPTIPLVCSLRAPLAQSHTRGIHIICRPVHSSKWLTRVQGPAATRRRRANLDPARIPTAVISCSRTRRAYSEDGASRGRGNPSRPARLPAGPANPPWDWKLSRKFLTRL